jgi:hypothetical protein
VIAGTSKRFELLAGQGLEVDANDAGRHEVEDACGARPPEAQLLVRHARQGAAQRRQELGARCRWEWRWRWRWRRPAPGTRGCHGAPSWSFANNRLSDRLFAATMGRGVYIRDV